MEAVVFGAGVAGLTAALLLRRSGVRVVCVDPDPPPRQRVGESLDWAAPALLDQIGFGFELIQRGDRAAALRTGSPLHRRDEARRLRLHSLGFRHERALHPDWQQGVGKAHAVVAIASVFRLWLSGLLRVARHYRKSRGRPGLDQTSAGSASLGRSIQ